MFFMKALTKRQAELLDLIERSEIPPSLREIGRWMGIKSTNGVNDHIEALCRKGRVKPRVDLYTRNLVVLVPLTPEERSENGLPELKRCPTCNHRIEGVE
jgi:repressor LexA